MHSLRTVGRQRRMEGWWGLRVGGDVQANRTESCKCPPTLPSHHQKWDGPFSVVSPGVIVMFHAVVIFWVGLEAYLSIGFRLVWPLPAEGPRSQ